MADKKALNARMEKSDYFEAEYVASQYGRSLTKHVIYLLTEDVKAYKKDNKISAKKKLITEERAQEEGISVKR